MPRIKPELAEKSLDKQALEQAELQRGRDSS